MTLFSVMFLLKPFIMSLKYSLIENPMTPNPDDRIAVTHVNRALTLEGLMRKIVSNKTGGKTVYILLNLSISVCAPRLTGDRKSEML
jgi:hypothetical protein